MKRFLSSFFLFLALFFIIPTTTKAYEYELNIYDINIVVNENNTLDITEKIGAFFNVDKHGIFRKIPKNNRIIRLDGTTSTTRAKISNILVSDQSTTYTEGNYQVVKIGNPNQTVNGQKGYIIKYSYDLGKDPSKDYDELYFNLIGNEWNDTTISNITFSITMPKEFDASLLGFSSGVKGSTDSSKISYEVNGNIITGKLNGTLNPTEGLTVRLQLPEGYFLNANDNIDIMTKLSFILPIIFVIIALGLWFIFGKDNRVIETVEFYPPEGFNSAEIGFLYKGQAGNEEVVSLLIYLANKGYIKITETEENSLFSKIKGFKITKLKEYDGDNANERLFLKGLFSKKSTSKSLDFDDMIEYMKNPQEDSEEDSTDSLNTVSSSDLEDNFYITSNKITSNLNSKENKHKIFEKNSLAKGIVVILMIIATFLLITVKPVIEYQDPMLLPFALLFPGIGFSIMFAVLFGKNPISAKIFILIWGLPFGGIPWAIMVLPALQSDPIYLTIYILGLVCVLAMILIYKAMPKRTPYGNEILGKIRGFKNFLETAEKEQLEQMVFQEPTYFYDILPYTYVLGVSDKWINKFESIITQPPSWYDGSTFDIVTFGSFMASTMAVASTAMSSSPSSSSGSGGGSSGGGSGGGGGGSW